MSAKLLFKGPVLTASGYGEHARQLLSSLIQSKKFDVYVKEIKWGETPYLLESDEFLNEVQRLIEKTKKSNVKYDVSVQLTIPPEFEKIASVNIGITAGIEVDRVSPLWISKANEMDAVIVPSVHSAQTYAGPKYHNDKGEILQLCKPLFICPEAVDTSVYNTNPVESEYDFPAPFNFISVGLGFEKGMGEDRKNLSMLVKWFCEKFKDDENVGLVLKVSMLNYSSADKQNVLNRIKQIKQSVGSGQFPRIHLVHGRLSPQQMASLYKHPNVKAYVSLTHGEGFGLPIIEAAACGLPVMATNWSGHLDFLSVDGKQKFIPIDFEMKQIPQSVVWGGVIEQGSGWAYPKEEDFKHKAKKLILSYDKPKQWAEELAKHIAEAFSLQSSGNIFLTTVNNILSGTEISKPRSEEEIVENVNKQLFVNGEEKTLLYTMPMSAGDVYCSTSIIDSLKKKYPEYKIYFATDTKYFSILKDNPNVYACISWQNWMTNPSLCEEIFDIVYTPNLAVQLNTANWVHNGNGRKLEEEFAHQCDVELGQKFIKLEKVQDLPEKYIVFNPGSGQGQWEARNYIHWQEVINNLLNPAVAIVQVGLSDDTLYDGVVDFRGKTNYNQLATVVKNAELVIGIDTCTSHFAAGLGTKQVSLYGSSYASSTGPVGDKNKITVLEPACRRTCKKACYKYQCKVDREYPCINDIEPKQVVIECLKIIYDDIEESMRLLDYKEHRPKIAGYTHVFNAQSQGYPFEQSIRSMLGFCDSVVVVEGGSTDGTKETLDKLKEEFGEHLNVIEHTWDWDEPGMDGMQKAFGRAMCDIGPNDFLWQMDADEIVRAEDYEKIKTLVKRFPKQVDLLHLPVIELWGDNKTVRTDRHSWKWRLSRNNFRITHGINKTARVFDEKTGKTFAKKGMSDGCEYIDIMTQEYIPHGGFYTQELEELRRTNPQEYGEEMNKIFATLPSVVHYSWADLPRKVRNFRDFWEKCWANLYNEKNPVPRFPNVNTEEEVLMTAEKLKEQGGEHGNAETFQLK